MCRPATPWTTRYSRERLYWTVGRSPGISRLVRRKGKWLRSVWVEPRGLCRSLGTIRRVVSRIRFGICSLEDLRPLGRSETPFWMGEFTVSQPIAVSFSIPRSSYPTFAPFKLPCQCRGRTGTHKLWRGHGGVRILYLADRELTKKWQD